MSRVLFCLALILAVGRAQRAVGQEAAEPAAVSPQRAVLNRYCVTCHNEKLKTADLMLDKADVDHVAAGAAVWEKVVRKLRTGAMPPAGMPRPDAVTYASLATYLETNLDQASAAAPNPGRPADHRLNRTEYANAIRDLLGLEIDGNALLPPDDSSHGFDNMGDVLSTSPLLMERYMAVAVKVARTAIGDRTIRPTAQEYQVSPELMQDARQSEELPFGTRGGIAIHHTFPLDAEYVIRIRLQRNNDGYIRGLLEPHRMDVRLDGVRIQQFTVGGEHKGRSGPVYTRNDPDYRGDPDQVTYEMGADEALEVRFAAQAGTRLVAVTFLEESAKPEGRYIPPLLHEDMAKYKGGDPGVDVVTILGPYNAKGSGETVSRRRIFTCTPQNSKDEEPCARKIVTSLARRAYRRPPTAPEIQDLLALYQNGHGDGGFEAGIAMALERILAGPEFLFRVERDPSGVASGTAYRIGDVDLASRLAFFLWSSIPDDELLDLAERGKLKDRAVLEQQVRRMLADQRANALGANFGGQWLTLRNMRLVAPDKRLFPDFDDELRDAMQEETLLFFNSMLREDRPVTDLLSADYTFVNERLARNYGIPNVYGSNFRRVTVTDENRRGLLGQGSILTVTSRPNRTSPVLRGKWVLDNLLGAPPPPPPPNVPALKDKAENGKMLPVRQQLEQHRANAVCASCHARMDPIGFSLDHFNAIGQWRTNDAGAPLDVSGTLADGTKFDGAVELRKVLLARKDQFTYTVAEKLLTYALGRDVQYSDAPDVRKILREAAPSDYRWSSLILGVVESRPFQMRKTADTTVTAGLR